jgi:predicted nucleic acid-binding protein
MEHPVTAVYDANILYPAPLRDLFIRVAQAGLVRARWTETIHEEWIRNVLKDNPRLSAERLARTRTLMNEAVRDCLVTGYEDLIQSLSLPDPDDRHVLAAAIRAGAGVIVTYNLTDFPAETLARFDIEAQHPDDFLVGLLDLAPGISLRRHQAAAGEPAKPSEDGPGTACYSRKPGAYPSGCPAPPVQRLALIASPLSPNVPSNTTAMPPRAVLPNCCQTDLPLH